MRLEPVLLLEDPEGPVRRSDSPATRVLSRRAVIAAVFGGGAALGAAALLSGRRSVAASPAGLATVDSLARLERLSPAALMAGW